jgi:hypothetical protein
VQKLKDILVKANVHTVVSSGEDNSVDPNSVEQEN